MKSPSDKMLKHNDPSTRNGDPKKHERSFSFPEHGVTIQAIDQEQAFKKLQALLKESKTPQA